MKFGIKNHQGKSIWINFGIEKSFKIMLAIGCWYDNLRTRSLETRESSCLAKACIEKYYIFLFHSQIFSPSREFVNDYVYIVQIISAKTGKNTHWHLP